MRWVLIPGLAFGLLLTPSLRADPSATTGVAAASRAKYLDIALDSDALAQARERARQLCVQGAGPAELPAQTSPRFLTLDAASGTAAGIVYAWAVPDARSRSHRALVLAGKILSGDLATGLGAELVARRRLATAMTAGLFAQSGFDLFVLQVSGTKTVHLEQIETLVEESLARLGLQGPEASELERAQDSLEAEIADNVGAQPEVLEFARAYPAVSAAEVQSAVLAYLTPSRRTTVEIKPRGSPEPWVPKPTDIVRPGFRLHTVKQGETLGAVAKRHGLSANALAKANGIDGKASPYVGQTLKIPQQAARAAVSKRDAVSKATRTASATPKNGGGAARTRTEPQPAKRPPARKKR